MPDDTAVNIGLFVNEPLVDAHGKLIGMFCVVDHAKRSLNPKQKEGLKLAANLAGQLAAIIDPAGNAQEALLQPTNPLGDESRSSLPGPAPRAESLETLAGGIAHDFNNLLMTIMGNASLAMRDLPGNSPGRMRKSLAAINEAAARAAELCRQMLAYSGQGRFFVQPVNLNELVAEVVQSLQLSLAPTIVIAQELATQLPPVVADAMQMRQVIEGLLTNAIESLDKAGDGLVRVSTSAVVIDDRFREEFAETDDLPDGSYVQLQISDTGCGMNQATKSRIFEPFFTTKFVGRGLGLAAAYGIVRGHQGTILVDSEPGGGSTFKVLVPLCRTN